jgi:hypothetical protein
MFPSKIESFGTTFERQYQKVSHPHLKMPGLRTHTINPQGIDCPSHVFIALHG